MSDAKTQDMLVKTVTEMYEQYQRFDMNAVASELCMSIGSMLAKINDLLDRGEINQKLVMDSATQEWLKPCIAQALGEWEKLSEERALSVLMKLVEKSAPKGKRADFTQLRVALMEQNQKWGNLKSGVKHEALFGRHPGGGYGSGASDPVFEMMKLRSNALNAAVNCCVALMQKDEQLRNCSLVERAVLEMADNFFQKFIAKDLPADGKGSDGERD